VTNDLAQDNTQVVQEVCGLRWKIEQFHRETKQLTGTVTFLGVFLSTASIVSTA